MTLCVTLLYPRANSYSQLPLVLTPQIERGKPIYKQQSIIVDGGVCRDERAAGLRVGGRAAESQLKLSIEELDGERPELRDFRCFLPLFSFQVQGGEFGSYSIR